MSKNFWLELQKPIIAQAPMADVTDAAFRQLIAKYGKPDVMWTEFVSVEGLTHSVGRTKLIFDLKYNQAERPIVAQVFGADPEKFYEVAKFCVELGFDGVDVNFGCPVAIINKQRAGTDLIRNPELAQEIIRATMRGVADAESDIPVSVKTRTGYNSPSVETWIPQLLETKPAALILHARTRKEMSKVPAPWERIKLAREIRDSLGSDTLVIGNGDVNNLTEAFARVEETGVDGVMIGRGFFGKPWLCSNLNEAREAWKQKDFEKLGQLATVREGLDLHERLVILLEHAQLFEELVMPHKPFSVMRKHFGSYVSGFAGAKDLRSKMMSAEGSKELKQIIEDSVGRIEPS